MEGDCRVMAPFRDWMKMKIQMLSNQTEIWIDEQVYWNFVKKLLYFYTDTNISLETISCRLMLEIIE